MHSNHFKFRHLIFFIAFISLHYNSSFAQDKAKRLGIYEIDLREYPARKENGLKIMGVDSEDFNSLSSISSQLILAYSGNPDFVVIDKRNQQLIKSEQERQKSEEFIDGYTINQGKNEGMDYIMMPKYILASKSVAVMVYNVETGDVLCKAETNVAGKSKGAVNHYSSILIQMLNDQCFGITMPVVRILKSKGDKAKELLLAAGHNQNLKKGFEVEICDVVVEKVGDKTINRNEIIGKAEIIKVEDDNFSVIEITSGSELVTERINAGKQLNCKLLHKT